MCKSIMRGLGVVAALAVCLPVIANDGKIQSELLDRMNQSSRAAAAEDFRVIITLDGGEYAEPWRHFGRQAGPPEHIRAHIRQVQDRALSRMSPKARERVSYRFQAQHALSASLSAKEIRALASQNDVVLIEEQPVHQKMHPESHPLTGTDDAHALGHTGAGTTIAIIDDGIMSSHAAFGGSSGFPTSKVIGGRDFADNDSDPRNDCTGQSHGTAVAGVSAGNGGGALGAAPDAEIVFLKIQSAGICGSNSLDGDVIGAIDWVTANQGTYGIDVINMSLGGGLFSSVCDSSHTAYRNAVNGAHAAGVAIFAASGNDAAKSQLSRPACFSNVISVGAVYDANIGAANFSNCSDSTTSPDKVNCYSNSASFLDILAPSFCARTADTGGGANNCFGGTSSASPFAAGVGATVLSAASGSLTPNQLRDNLANNGVAVTDPANSITKPRVDTLASIAALGGGGGGPDELQNGVPETGLSGSQNSETHFYIDVPAGASNLEFDISGGSGDADLYVRHGSQPTTGTYDCRPWLNGNNETCTEASPSAGTWYVMLHGYNAYSGVTLVASFDEPGGGGAPCSGCDEYTGSLSNGGSEVQPDGTYYFSVAGLHEGWLSGAAGTDFDLRLFRWNSGWTQVDSSLSATSEEHIAYNGSSGYYYWRVESYSGSGPYTFWLQRP